MYIHPPPAPTQHLHTHMAIEYKPIEYNSHGPSVHGPNPPTSHHGVVWNAKVDSPSPPPEGRRKKDEGRRRVTPVLACSTQHTVHSAHSTQHTAHSTAARRSTRHNTPDHTRRACYSSLLFSSVATHPCLSARSKRRRTFQEMTAPAAHIDSRRRGRGRRGTVATCTHN